MDTALAQLRDRLLTLEQENASLKSRLQSCERSHAVLQAEVAAYRRGKQDGQELATEVIAELATPNNISLEHCLLEATAEVANALLTIIPFNAAVNTALQVIGESLDTDRIILIETLDSPCDSAFPNWRASGYEWSSLGTVPQCSDSDAAQGSYEEIGWLYNLLQQGQTASYLIEDAPESFRSEQIAIGVKSTHLVPIFVEGQWWGVLGFDDCREAKHRSSSELFVLKIVADCIGSAIQRDRTQQTLFQAEQARVAELAKANEELQQRDRLLSTVAAVSKNLLESAEVDSAITQALQRIGEVAGISRVGLMQEKSEIDTGRMQHHVVLEWSAPNIPPQNNDPLTQIIYTDEYEVLTDKLRAGRSIWHMLEDFPEPARTHQANIAVKSTGAVPIFIESKYYGCVFFDDCMEYRQWSTQEIDVLKSGAGAIGAAIHRQQLVDCLIAERIQAEQERSAELAKANEALRNAIAGLARLDDLDQFLAEMLKVSIEISGAQGGTVALVEGDDIHHAVLFDKAGLVSPQTQAEQGLLRSPFSAEFREIAQRILESEDAWVIYPDEPILPSSFQAFHREQGNCAIRLVPMRIGDRLLGWLGLGFAETDPPLGKSFVLLRVLAEQMTMAVELLRLAEAAKQAAIAREQEQAAQERAAELAKANAVLRGATDRLASNSSLEAFLEHVLAEACQDAIESGAIFLYEETQAHLVPVVMQGVTAGYPYSVQQPVPIAAFPVWLTLLRTKQPLVIDVNKQSDLFAGDTLAWHRIQGHQGIVLIPLMIGNQPLGMFGIASCNKVNFKETELELFQALAQQATLAIQLTQLAEAAKQTAIAREQEKAAQERAAELARANEALKRATLRLSSLENIELFIQNALIEVIQEAGAKGAAIFQVIDDSECLQMTHYAEGSAMLDITTDSRLEVWRYTKKPVGIWGSHNLLNGEILWHDYSKTPIPQDWEEAFPFHQMMGHKTVACIPFLIGGVITGFLGICFEDLTSPTESKIQLCKTLSQHVALALHFTQLADEAKQAAILEERNRMASEIHDTLAQAFTGISLQLEVAKSLVEADPQAVQQILHHISQLAEAGLTEARRSVWALYPPAAEYADLAQLLYESVEHMTRNTEIAVEVDVQGNACPLPPFLGMNLLRIGQEALTNALKHAQAQRIFIELTYKPDRIWLSIADDGRGFTLPTQIDSLNGGFGLVGMYERCDRIGAQLSIYTQPRQGTQILVEAVLG